MKQKKRMAMMSVATSIIFLLAPLMNSYVIAQTESSVIERQVADALSVSPNLTSASDPSFYTKLSQHFAELSSKASFYEHLTLQGYTVLDDEATLLAFDKGSALLLPVMKSGQSREEVHQRRSEERVRDGHPSRVHLLALGKAAAR